MILAAVGWALLGAVVVGVLVTFWDNIKNWLNNVAAEWVEKYLGYGARNRMHKAVAKVDRVMDVIKNRSVIYTKADRLATHFDKTTIISEAPVYKIDKGVLDEIRKEGSISQEFEYIN